MMCLRSVNESNQRLLVAGLNRCREDCGENITKHTIAVYSRGDLATANEVLREWEAAGKLEILKPLETAGDDEAVVRLK
jgi:hypothetical protein